MISFFFLKKSLLNNGQKIEILQKELDSLLLKNSKESETFKIPEGEEKEHEKKTTSVEIKVEIKNSTNNLLTCSPK